MPNMFSPAGPRMQTLEIEICDQQNGTLFFCSFHTYVCCCRWPKTEAAYDEYIKLEFRTTPVEGPPNSYRSEEVCFTDVLNREVYRKKFDKEGLGQTYRWRSGEGVEEDGWREDGIWKHELDSYEDSAFWGPLKYCHGPVGNRDALNFPFTELSFRLHGQRVYKSKPVQFTSNLNVCGVKVLFGKPGEPGFSRWSWKGKLSIIEDETKYKAEYGESFWKSGKIWYYTNSSSNLHAMTRTSVGRKYLIFRIS